MQNIPISTQTGVKTPLHYNQLGVYKCTLIYKYTFTYV